MAGEIICEKPNNAIHKFEGCIKISQLDKNISLGTENLLLRSCSLRNTEFIYGVAIFTGHDTKVMKNNAKSKYKFSSLEKMTNQSIFVILGTQLIMSIIGSLVGSTWTQIYSQLSADHDEACMVPDISPNWCQFEKAYYLNMDAGHDKEHGFPFPQKLGTWILIFTNLVPISLMVTAEMVKLF